MMVRALLRRDFSMPNQAMHVDVGQRTPPCTRAMALLCGRRHVRWQEHPLPAISPDVLAGGDDSVRACHFLCTLSRGPV